MLMGLEGFEGGRVEGFSILAVHVFRVQTCDCRDVDSELLRVQGDCLKWGCVLYRFQVSFPSPRGRVWNLAYFQKAHEYPNKGALGPTSFNLNCSWDLKALTFGHLHPESHCTLLPQILPSLLYNKVPLVSGTYLETLNPHPQALIPVL